MLEKIGFFVAGALTQLSDSGRKKEYAGTVAGALLGILSAFSPDIVLGTALGNLLAGKIDKKSHYLLLASLLLVVILLKVMPSLFIIPFTLAAYVDERFENIRRLALPITALLLSPLIGFSPLIYGVLFDVGYELTGIGILKKGQPSA